MKTEKSKHTPGPWIVNDIYPADVYGRDEVTGRSRHISTGIDVRGGNCCYTEEDRANAALIAAAPDLLAALEFCSDALNTEAGGLYAAHIAQARAAIAKARGEK